MASWRHPLRTLIVVSLILVSAFGFLLWNGAQQNLAEQRAVNLGQADQHSAILAEALAPALQINARKSMLAVLVRQRSAANILDASVFDNRGELLASLGSPLPLLQALEPGQGTAHVPIIIDNGGLRIERPIEVGSGAERARAGVLQVIYPAEAGSLANALSWVNLAIAALASVLVLGLLGWTLAPLARELGELEVGVSDFHSGNWEARVDSTGATAGVAESLNALAADQKKWRNRLLRDLEQRKQESKRLNSMLRDSQVVVWEADPASGQFSYISEAAEALMGHPLGVWLDPGFIDDYVHPSDAEWLLDYFRHPGTDVDSFSMELRVRDKAGEWRWLKMITSIELRDAGPIPGGLMLDITEQKQSEQQVALLSDHDDLTGLLNRRRLIVRLHDFISRKETNTPGVAVLVIDLAHFQLINERFGVEAGDDYLREVAGHLRELVGRSAALARLGADEFGLALPQTDAAAAVEFAGRLLSELAGKNFVSGEHQVPFSAHLGIVTHPDHGFSATDLLGRAEVALRVAKSSGPSGHHLFVNDDEASHAYSMSLAIRLRTALERDDIRLFFQPVVDLKTGAIRQYATSFRWMDQDDAPVRPRVLERTAEEFGLTDAIDRWLVVNSLRHQHTSADPGYEPALLLKLSRQHIAKPDILELLRDTARLYKLSPSMLTIAVDAEAVGADIDRAQFFIRLIQDSGQRFALDRFGSAGLSLAQLQDLPLDMIRFDEPLVRKLPWSQANQVFVKATAEIARAMNVSVVAPAVGDQQTLGLLRDYGVRYGHGSLFAEPEQRFHELGRVVIATG